MVGHQVPAAFLAVLPLTNLGLLKHRDILGARSYTRCPRLPETKSVYWTAGPRTTRTAMTVAHGFRSPETSTCTAPQKHSPLSDGPRLLSSGSRRSATNKTADYERGGQLRRA